MAATENFGKNAEWIGGAIKCDDGSCSACHRQWDGEHLERCPEWRKQRTYIASDGTVCTPLGGGYVVEDGIEKYVGPQ